MDQNPFIWLSIASVELPDGTQFEQYVMRMRRTATTVVVDDQDRVLLMWRHRFIVDRWVCGGWVSVYAPSRKGHSPAGQFGRHRVLLIVWARRDATPRREHRRSQTGTGHCPGSGKRPAADVPLVCWLPVRDGLTPHGLRHSHKTWIPRTASPRYSLSSASAMRFRACAASTLTHHSGCATS